MSQATVLLIKLKQYISADIKVTVLSFTFLLQHPNNTCECHSFFSSVQLNAVVFSY